MGQIYIFDHTFDTYILIATAHTSVSEVLVSSSADLDLLLNICKIQPNICRIQPNICQTQPNICQIQPNICQTQANICQTQANICPTQPNICQTKPNICQTQPNIYLQIVRRQAAHFWECSKHEKSSSALKLQKYHNLNCCFTL